MRKAGASMVRIVRPLLGRKAMSAGGLLVSCPPLLVARVQQVLSETFR